ncbi:MAG: transposase [Phycisphaerales bacterium]|jgi:hypothetical protein
MSSKSTTPAAPRPEQLEWFLEQLKPRVSRPVYEMACWLVKLVQSLLVELERKRVSVGRLRQLIFGPSKNKREQSGSPVSGEANASAGKRRSGGNPKGKGHGRNSLKRAFWGAIRHLVLHPTLKSGSACGPDCSGKMNVMKRVKSVARIFGQPFLPMHIWDQQGLRCSACQRLAWAPLPPEVTSSKHDPTAASMVAILVYANGMPLSRLTAHQKSCGVPIPETVLWELLAHLADDCAPVHDALLSVAAQGNIFHNDDTYRKILSMKAGCGRDEDIASDAATGKKERTGTFTSVIVSRAKEQTSVLFFTGRRHAGENLQEVLRRRRRELPKPIQMCDALSRNCPSEFDTVLCNCLAHAGSKVADLRKIYPEPVNHVLGELKKIHAVEARARKEHLTDWQRLQLHREQSLPVLDALCGWLEAQFAEKLVEPNSSLGEAFAYMLNHWYQLTQFTRVPGAPLENNFAERMLKMAIRHRKNSLFYKTLRGAEVGDRLMSLIQTTQLAGVDPFGYLTALQRHRDAAMADPAAWLPWNFEKTMAAQKATPAPKAAPTAGASHVPADGVPKSSRPAPAAELHADELNPVVPASPDCGTTAAASSSPVDSPSAAPATSSPGTQMPALCHNDLANEPAAATPGTQPTAVAVRLRLHLEPDGPDVHPQRPRPPGPLPGQLASPSWPSGTSPP